MRSAAWKASTAGRSTSSPPSTTSFDPEAVRSTSGANIPSSGVGLPRDWNRAGHPREEQLMPRQMALESPVTNTLKGIAAGLVGTLVMTTALQAVDRFTSGPEAAHSES